MIPHFQAILKFFSHLLLFSKCSMWILIQGYKQMVFAPTEFDSDFSEGDE